MIGGECVGVVCVGGVSRWCVAVGVSRMVYDCLWYSSGEVSLLPTT